MFMDGKANDKDKKTPPFANKAGNLGNTKTWNEKTYYYCPANHKYSHWHMHKVEDCNTYKKMQKKEQERMGSSSSSSTQVVINKEKLKKGMAALFPSGDFDTCHFFGFCNGGSGMTPSPVVEMHF